MHDPRRGSLQYQNLLESPRLTRDQLDELRDDLRRIRIYTGTLVSFDGQSTAILIGAPALVDRADFYRRIREILSAQGPVPGELLITGAPVAESLLGIHLLEDLGVPTRFLGATLRGAEDSVREGKSFSSWGEFARLITRRVGLVPISILMMLIVFQISFRRGLATLCCRWQRSVRAWSSP